MKIASPGRIWPYWLAVLLLPLIVLLHQDNSLFTPPGQVDSWVYLGFFRNLVNFKRSLFPSTYYGSRLSWILPGYLVHSLFPPIAAACVLHMVVYSVATLSFFTILRLTSGVRSAFLATIVFCVTPSLWYATGWDYVDGAGVAYCLLAMALLTRTALRRGGRASLLLAGVAIAGLVYSNLFWVALVPLLLFYYVAMAWAWHRGSIIRSVLIWCLWCGAGFGIVTIAFAGVNYLVDGHFWFYAPSVQFLRGYSLQHNRWYTSIWTEKGLWPWLWFTAVAAIAAILLPFRLRRDAGARAAPALIFSVQFLVALGLLGYVQSRGTPVLGLSYYASYLLPFEFLVIGVYFWPAAEKMRLRTYLLVCSAAALIFGAIWWDYDGRLTPIWPAAIRETALIGTGIFAVAAMLRHRVLGSLLAIAGCAVFTSEARFIVRAPIISEVRNSPPASAHAYRDTYERVIRARGKIESVRNGNLIRFWYDPNEPSGLEYAALNSTYLYAFTWLGENPAQQVCEKEPRAGDVIAISSGKEGVREAAQSTLANCWTKLGLIPTLAAFDTSGTAIFRADPNPAVRHSLQVSFDSAGTGHLQPSGDPRSHAVLPLEQWKPLISGTEKPSVKPVTAGVAVHTPDRQYAWGAMYAPLIAPSTGHYHFALKYRPQSGQFAFGGFAGDSSHWLSVTITGHPAAENDSEMSFSVDLKGGETILLRIENNSASGNHPASFVMKELTALKVD